MHNNPVKKAAPPPAQTTAISSSALNQAIQTSLQSAMLGASLTTSYPKNVEVEKDLHFSIIKAQNGYILRVGQINYVAKTPDELFDAIKLAMVNAKLEE